MPQDFSGQNLRGRSFKGQNLSGANFDGTDIRGADFTNALLIGTNFKGAEAGLQKRWVVGLVVCSWLLAGLSALFSTIFFSTVVGIWAESVLKSADQQSLIAATVTLITLVIFFIIIFRKGLVALALAFAFAFAIFGAVAFFANIATVGVTAAAASTVIVLTTVVVVAVIGAFAIVGAVAAAFAVAGAVATAFAVVGAVAAVVFAVLGLMFGVALGEVTAAAATLAATIAIALTLTSAYLGWRSWAGDEKYATVRSLAIAFAALEGTSFRGANLTDANFTQARLKGTDMRGAIITRTYWHKTKMLDQVRPGTTYLQNSQLRQVLVTGLGQEKYFDRQDLREVNLQGANLADASFISTDLSAASLQDADLSRAKLVQTQLDETDLTGATLTGACIEDWGITTHTKLERVKCEYIFMRYVKPKDLDQNRRRKPDNWEEKFEDGDFSDFIKPIVDTLDLYHTQGVDPRAIAIAFKQLAENHPDAELEFAAMEKRGQDNLLLKLKTAPDVDKSLFNSEYFSTYNKFKGLSEQEVRLLLVENNIRLGEKDNQIRKLEIMVNTALQPSSVYSQTHIHKVETMSHNPGGFSVNGSVGGNVNNVQGDNNSTVQGDNNRAVQGNNNQVTQQNQLGGDAEASLTKDDIIKLLAELETLIRGAEIPAELKEEVIEDLSAAKNATDKEEPNKIRALARLDSVAETLEKTSKTVDSGRKLWSTAKPIIVKIAGWLGAATGSHLLDL